MKVIVVGGGNTIYLLCRNFITKGYSVTIINRNHDECLKLARRLNAPVIHGDGSDVRMLKDAGISETDTLLAMTPYDQDNLVICQIAALRYGVPKVVALANDPENVEVYRKLGIEAFSTSQIISSLIEQRAVSEKITNLLPIDEGKANLFEIVLDESSPVVGKSLKDINFPKDALISMIIRKEQLIIPRGDHVLLVDDRVVLIALPGSYGPAIRLFSTSH